MPIIKHFDTYTEISNINFFSLEKTLDCGQCFRFEKKDDYFYGIAFGKFLKAFQKDDNTIHLYVPKEDVPFWYSYFSLDEDYSSVRSTFPSDKITALAMDISSGIRILRQDMWEALCSFIISQNNNIPRIKKLVEALCREFGDEIPTPYGIFYSFPSAERISLVSEEKLSEMKFGFRASYIISAAKTVANDPDFLTKVKMLPTNDAIRLLTTIKGVGPKVASCTLLFGFNKTDAFPIDVWVRRILEKYYPNLSESDACQYFGKYAGIAQQYLFYYERYVVEGAKS